MRNKKVFYVAASMIAGSVAFASQTLAITPGTPISLNGAVVTAIKLDKLTTASGAWSFDYLGKVAGIAAYRWQRDGSTATRVMLCRGAAITEAGDTTQLSLQAVQVKIGSYSVSAGVAPGACRIVEDKPLVDYRADWIVQAVKDGRLPAYTRARSWIAQATPPLETVSAYDPSVIGGQGGQTGPVNASKNFVGVTSGQGGEYDASRGFLHDIDARVVDLAINKQPIGSWATLQRYSWESLAQPQAAAWSTLNNVTVDPQFPQPGDHPYATAGLNTAQHIDSLVNIEGWQRDVFHLENTCYAHWLATADPVAGMCVQRQLAFALAEYGENLRIKTPASYAADTGQIRGILNMLSALWKSRDVAARVTSNNGMVLWNTQRIDKMKTDIFTYLDPTIAPAPSSDPWSKARRIWASMAPSAAGVGFFQSADGSTPMVTTSSNFMLVQYGKEPLYLWARSGDPLARKWLEIGARHIAARVEYVGGAKAIDQCSPLKGLTNGANVDTTADPGGSNYPVSPAAPRGTTGFTGTMPGWTTVQGWAIWMNTLCQPGPSDRYDGAAIHTAEQAEGLLLLAKAAGVSGLDSAITRMAADKAHTSPSAIRYTSLNMAKHWAAPIETLAGK